MVTSLPGRPPPWSGSPRDGPDVGRWLPLSVVCFTPAAVHGEHGQGGYAILRPVHGRGRATARTARKLAFSVSYDDGRTWHAEAGMVSLRVTLTDVVGNALRQTIHRAYRSIE